MIPRRKLAFGTQPGFFGERCKADLYVDAVGMKVAIDNFMMLACREASLAVVGVHHEPVPLDLMSVCYSNWKIMGGGGAPIEVAMADILEMMRSRRYDLPSLVTHEFKVEQIADALVMGTRANEAQKVCVSF